MIRLDSVKLIIWDLDDTFWSGTLSEGGAILPDENAAFERPDWLGEEVTGDPRYYNSMLMKNPFKNWK